VTHLGADHTGSASVSFAGNLTITGAWATTGYSAEAQRDLLDRAPLPLTFPEPLHKWLDKLAGTPAADMLADLHIRFGLGWRRIAQLLGVSVRAVNKWRDGGGLSPASDLAVRKLLAFSELARGEGVLDLNAWMASQPIADVLADRAELYAAGAVDALLDNLQSPLPLGVVSQWIPRWREKALAVTPLHLQIDFDTDGDVIASTEELPWVFAVASSLDEARHLLILELQDYANDWVDHLHEAPNHAGYRDIVNLIRSADDEKLLGYLHADA
jgi:hypothetical protein